jgi:CrcB protein
MEGLLRMNLLWVCFGGAAGSGARYLLSTWLQHATGSGFPWGTLAVNAVGSFLMSLLMVVGLETAALSPALRLGLTTGVLGGFTTYSAFNYETLGFLQEGAPLAASANVLGTLLACLVAGFLGYQAGHWLVRR